MSKSICDAQCESCDLISRRQVLRGAGKVAVGAAAAAAFSGIAMLPKARAAASYPWPYKKIDPKKAGEIAYENW